MRSVQRIRTASEDFPEKRGVAGLPVVPVEVELVRLVILEDGETK